MDTTPDLTSERAVLGGIFNHGSNAYFDVADIINANTFADTTNQVIYKCFVNIFEQDHDAKLDFSLVVAKAKDLGYGKLFEQRHEATHLRTITNTKVELVNVRKLGAKLRKLQIARDIVYKIEKAKGGLCEITGDESLEEILSLIEGPIFDYTNTLGESNNKSMNLLHEGIDAYVQNIIDNPVERVGISTGYPTYDACIGGGLMGPEIDIIGARMKTGKTVLADNIAIYVAETYNIPVINLDTEMSREQHWNRILAKLSHVTIDEIKTGKFTKTTRAEYGTGEEKTARVLAAKERLKKMPYFYDCIANRPFEETIASLRRWIMKEVGFDDTGKAKPCLIVYDYIKLLSADGLNASMHEFQLLGFLVTSLKNFLIRYNVPCLAFCQLNRDAIEKETTDVVMGSDRILMFCSSFAIYKTKTREEIAEDGVKNGNRKLIPKIARNGPAMEDGNYICMEFNGDFAEIKELKTKEDVDNEKEDKKAFEIEKNKDDDNNEEIPFG